METATMLDYFSRSKVICAHLLAMLIFVPFRLYSLFFFRAGSSSPGKILVQTGYRLGDLLMVSQALLILRRSFPGTEISLLSSPMGCDFIRKAGWVDRLIPIDPPWLTPVSFVKTIHFYMRMSTMLGSRRFDTAIDFMGDPRGSLLFYLSGIPRIYSFADFGAAPFCSRWWFTPRNLVHQVERNNLLALKITETTRPAKIVPLWPRQTETKNDDALHKETGLILIHIGASNPARQWSLSRFGDLGKALLFAGMRPLFVGGLNDRPDLEKIKELAGDHGIEWETPSFVRLEELLTEADAVVCHDSFMMHAAWAFGKPLVVLYGPSNPRQFGPVDAAATVVWNNQLLKYPYTEWSGSVPIESNTVGRVLEAVANQLPKDPVT